MTKELKTSIEDLYQTFSKHPLKGKIEGCPCCVSESDKSVLHSRPLKELTDADLSLFAFKAMSTFGEVEDFKHFLPRILELSVKEELMVDEFIVLGKLDYANWNYWPINEQDRIRTFLLNWWSFLINNRTGFNSYIFIEISKKFPNFHQLIDCWKTDINSIGFVNLLEFIEFHYNNLTYGLDEYKNWSPTKIEQLKKWIDPKTRVIEKGFFYYESINKPLAESASNALYILETLNRK